MTPISVAMLVLAGLSAQDAPRVAEMPKKVCIDAQRAIFQVENPGPTPLLATAGVERWSDDGDAPAWTVFHEDVTERNAQSKKGRSVQVDARSRRDVTWVLKQRTGSPPLSTGRYRLLATFVTKAGDPVGQVIHEFVITDCQ
jgi:hypothetical protein